MSDMTDISIVIPCYHKFNDFVAALPHNQLFLDKRVEVVLVLDEPSEEFLYVGLIKGHWKNVIKFKLIVNDKAHEWRPPCVPINVGIRHSSGDYCIVQSPETIVLYPYPGFIFDVIHREKFRKFYVTGLLTHVNPNVIVPLFSQNFYSEFEHRTTTDDFGFILFTRQDAIDIGGYDERRKFYGQDDDDIRQRLIMHKVKHVNTSQIRAAHAWRETAPRNKGNTAEPFGQQVVVPDQENMGSEFSRIAFDWRNA